jgi:hypothetical protein
MHRRPLGRGRTLAVIGALIILAGCLLPWFATGGGSDLPSVEYRAFDGPGILTFLAALLVLALVSLPYAAGDRPMAVDAWPSYLILLGLAILGVVAWPFALGLLEFPAGLLPDRAPGYWLAILGVVVLARATLEIQQRPVGA